jgi:hypothetical protein
VCEVDSSGSGHGPVAGNTVNNVQLHISLVTLEKN